MSARLQFWLILVGGLMGLYVFREIGPHLNDKDRDWLKAATKEV